MDNVNTNTTPFIQTNVNQTNIANSPRGEIFCWHYGNNVHLFTVIIISTWLSLAPPAIYCLYSQVQRDQVIPVFIINLLISDILQICCMIVEVARLNDHLAYYIIAENVYNGGVMASVFFITFIAMER
ncbi:hypothetical protein AMECASPLE_029043 [Ameca splendens]|uniref:G-protein coupled receptors family 1 profile domain-containing protein n=1 Tax=Ameca splendens TaxID=208324 RepID=A0ABV0ZQI1_9TELE